VTVEFQVDWLVVNGGSTLAAARSDEASGCSMGSMADAGSKTDSGNWSMMTDTLLMTWDKNFRLSG
jgi:hypothetical protein